MDPAAQGIIELRIPKTISIDSAIVHFFQPISLLQSFAATIEKDFLPFSFE
jgi:hypothetical protein